ncbi:MAG TPA: methyltransferase domain-containing protein [Gaiellaceae bacterium]|nr:methyltransferase domain-containing protein [Gaiellaceae bacterium]
MSGRPLTVRRVVRGAARRVPRAPFRFVMPAWLVRGPFRFWLSVLAADPDRRRAVRELLRLEEETRRQLDAAAIRYDDGVHAKHRLTAYHDFFVERVRPGERVLDVGSGKGELAHDLVVRAGAEVVGVDHDPAHLAFARERFPHERLTFLGGDVLEGLPEGGFDAIVLSNVLEHIDDRVGLLRHLVAEARPRVVLVRVPVLARDWTVPLRREVGLEYFSDPDHEVEYDEEGFRAELAEAGLRVTELKLVWGEIWAAAEPAG